MFYWIHLYDPNNENLQVFTLIEATAILKNQDALNQNNFPRLDQNGLLAARIRRVVVDRALDRSAGLELLEMLIHHLRVEGVGMVVVDLAAFLDRQLLIGAVIVIMAQNRHIALKAGDQILHQRRFAAAAAAGDADYNDI